MIEFLDALHGRAWELADNYVDALQDWFEGVFEKPLHEFCDKHQLYYSSWTMSFTDRDGKVVTPTLVDDPELKAQLMAISRLVHFTLSKEDRLGDVLASYCPWEKS